MELLPGPRASTGPTIRFVLGACLAAVLLAALAELFLRCSPPQDLYPYLGESSPLTGPYAPHEAYGVTYKNWDVFHEENSARLQEYLPWDRPQNSVKTWAFFGNSFVQAPGMLGETARAEVQDRSIFFLGRNEMLPLRFAQVDLLLQHGLKPERIFFNLMPVDTLVLGQQPLAALHVTSRGAVTYRALQSPAFNWLLEKNRLVLTGWVRAGKHQGNPGFRGSKLYEYVHPVLLDDLTRLFAELARVGKSADVPITVMLLPAFHQITRGAPFGFQDALTPILRRQGFDVFDPRDTFLSADQPEQLFLPDKHFNARGNRMLLEALLRHTRNSSPSSESLTRTR